MKKANRLIAALIALLLAPGFSSAQNNPKPELAYDSKGQFSFRNLPRKPADWAKYAAKRDSAYWGIYFWDFGDGTYFFQRAKRGEKLTHPVHKYIGKGPFTAKVYITPRLSPQNTMVLASKVDHPVDGESRAEWLTHLDKVTLDKREHAEGKNKTSRWIEIQASEDKCLVPDDAIRVAVHVKAPAANTDGTLLLLYKQVPASRKQIDPLKVTDLNLYGAARIQDPKNVSGEAQTAFASCLNDGYALLDGGAISIKSMKKQGDEHRVFLTLRSDKDLGKHLDKQVVFYLLGVWVPSNRPSKTETHASCEVVFTLNKVHDPNNIRGPRTLYARRGCARNLRYRVDFENNEKGHVRNAAIKIPVGQGFDTDSFGISRINPPFMPCPPNSSDTLTPCYEIKKTKDAVQVTFRNIGLARQNGWSKRKYSSGSFEFDIKTDGRLRANTALLAEITFDGNKQMATRKAVTHWRHHALYFKPGYAFGGNHTWKNLDSSSTLLRFLNASIAYQNAPIGTGFAFGAEIGLGGLRFGKTVYSLGELATDVLYYTRYIDIKVTGGFQLGPHTRLTAGIGSMFPIEGRFLYGFDNYVYRKENYRSNPGISWQWGVEAGLMNDIVVGLETQQRVFSDRIIGSSLTVSNYNVYLRINIWPLVGCKTK